jgi:hypothetical protein
LFLLLLDERVFVAQSARLALVRPHKASAIHHAQAATGAPRYPEHCALLHLSFCLDCHRLGQSQVRVAVGPLPDHICFRINGVRLDKKLTFAEDIHPEREGRYARPVHDEHYSGQRLKRDSVAGLSVELLEMDHLPLSGIVHFVPDRHDLFLWRAHQSVNRPLKSTVLGQERRVEGLRRGSTQYGALDRYGD